jgi:asparagine synthase (glutamine-hydrolysing)
MCGIAGVLRMTRPGERPPPPHASIPEHWLDILDDAIRHRGPDGTGRFRDRATRPDGTIVDVALVHRRLSIIDHQGGAQPMVHLRRPGGSGELLQPRPTRDNSSEGAPSVSDGPKSDGPSNRDETPRSRPGLLPSTEPIRRSPRTLDATAIPAGADLVAVAFNGCIYNHRELREELESLGHRFHTDHADTEVLVHAYRRWGTDLSEHLRSMHAAVIWDRARAELLALRDPFGQKPLYIATDDTDPDQTRIIAFSSTVPGLVRLFAKALPDRAPHLHRWNTSTTIIYGHAEPATPWDNIWALPQNTANFLAESITSLAAAPEPAGPDPAEARKEERILPKRPVRSFSLTRAASVAKRVLDPLDALLAEVVADHLDADVPVACLLSGGVDSSLVASYAAAFCPGLTTICVRMPDPRLDESEHAQAVADSLGTHHLTVDAEPNAASDLVRLIEALGLPFGDSSLLPTFWACRAAGRVAPVVLTGDGGDEMFVGYDRHMFADRLGPSSPLTLPLAWLVPTAVLPQRDPASITSRLARATLALRRASYDSLLALFPAPHAARLLGRSATKPEWMTLAGSGYEAACQDRAFTLPGDYLRKVDTASMQIPIETRAPLLDDRVRKLSDELGEHLTLGGRKGLLRALARRVLPAGTVDRPKQGFAIPIGEWFRSDFGGMRQLLRDHLESAEPFPGLSKAQIEIRIPYVLKMLREHDQAGEASRNPWHGRDHSQRLYMLLVLSIWCRWLQRTRRDAARALGPAQSA